MSFTFHQNVQQALFAKWKNIYENSLFYYVILICSQLLCFMVFKIQAERCLSPLYFLPASVFTWCCLLICWKVKFLQIFPTWRMFFNFSHCFVNENSIICCQNFSLFFQNNTAEIFPWNFQHQLNVTIF